MRHNLCGALAGCDLLIFLTWHGWARPWQLGWRHEGYMIVPVFTAILVTLPHKSSETYKHTEGEVATVERTLQKKTLDQVLASSFGFFSSSSAHVTGYCLSGDTYVLGEYYSGFLHFNTGYKWLHLCGDGTAVRVVSKPTTAEGILAALTSQSQMNKQVRKRGWRKKMRDVFQRVKITQQMIAWKLEI